MPEFSCPECEGTRYHRRDCARGLAGQLVELKPAVAVHILDGYIARITGDPDSAEQLAHARQRRKALRAGL